jgi:hypothetical protein
MCRPVLRDDQWERIKELLPGKASDCGVTAKDNRLFNETELEWFYPQQVAIIIFMTTKR